MGQNKKFRHLDLFSGIGGFALAASWVWGDQHEIVSFCEIEKFPQKILKKHWPEMLRVIKETKPNWIIGENVTGFINMDLEASLSDLETEGYETTAFILPACGVGAQHRRDRIWIVANAKADYRRWDKNFSFKRNGKNWKGFQEIRKSHSTGFEGSSKTCRAMAHPNKTGREELSLSTITSRKGFSSGQNGRRWYGWEQTEPPVCGAVNGVSNRVDRIKGLGNAIVPQVVVPIMAGIKAIEESD